MMTPERMRRNWLEECINDAERRLWAHRRLSGLHVIHEQWGAVHVAWTLAEIAYNVREGNIQELRRISDVAPVAQG